MEEWVMVGETFPYHNIWGGGGKYQALEAGRAPQEGWCRMQSGYYWGS